MGKCGSNLVKQFSSVCAERTNEHREQLIAQIMGNAVLSTGKSDTNYSKAINLTMQTKKEKTIGRLNS